MKSRIISSAVTIAKILFMAAIPAYAAELGLGVNASVNANVGSNAAGLNVRARGDANSSTTMEERRQAAIGQRIDNGMNRGGNEISARIDSLTKLEARIQGMKNLTDAEKASFNATIQTQVTLMNNLLIKIKSDTSTTSLMADLKTIAPSYRIYMLIQPQLSILAATDRVNTIVGMMQTLGTKFDARLAANANADASVKLADFKAKIADASVQANAATAEVANLQPDNGNQTVMASNTAALKDARAKLKVATDDIQAANVDARAIVKDLRGSKGAEASSTNSRN